MVAHRVRGHLQIRSEVRSAGGAAFAQPIRRQLLVAAATVNLGVNGLILTVLLDLADQGVPATRLGLLNSALAVSILLGALAAPRLVDRVPTGVLTVSALLLLAAVGTLPTMLLFSGVISLGTLSLLLGKDLRRVPVASKWEEHARAEGLAEPE